MSRFRLPAVLLPVLLLAGLSAQAEQTVVNNTGARLRLKVCKVGVEGGILHVTIGMPGASVKPRPAWTTQAEGAVAPKPGLIFEGTYDKDQRISNLVIDLPPGAAAVFATTREAPGRRCSFEFRCKVSRADAHGTHDPLPVFEQALAFQAVAASGIALQESIFTSGAPEHSDPSLVTAFTLKAPTASNGTYRLEYAAQRHQPSCVIL